MFLAWLVGFVLTTLVLGILYHKEIIDWKPSGGQRGGSDEGPPHMIIAAMWWIVGPIAAVVYGVIGLYKLFNIITKFLARISFDRSGSK